LNPSLLHAKVGGFIAMETYKVDNSDIINAILNHTTGRPEMSLLEKIIFIADYIEPGRKQAPNLTEVRKMAFMDLDKTMLKILGDTLAYLKESDFTVEEIIYKCGFTNRTRFFKVFTEKVGTTPKNYRKSQN